MLAPTDAHPAKPRLNTVRRVRVFLVAVLPLGGIHVRELAADEEADQCGDVGDAVVEDARGRGGGLGERALEEGEGCYGAVGVAGW